jgi:hypothetical protein
MAEKMLTEDPIRRNARSDTADADLTKSMNEYTPPTRFADLILRLEPKVEAANTESLNPNRHVSNVERTDPNRREARRDRELPLATEPRMERELPTTA